MPAASGSTSYWLGLVSGGPVVGVRHFTRVTADGATVATRDLACHNFQVALRRVVLGDDAAVVCKVEAVPTVHTLDARLQDVVAALPLYATPGFTVQQGIGDRLDDGSLLPFGRPGANVGDQATMPI